MKKVLLLFVFLFLISLTSCSNTTPTPDDDQNDNDDPVVDTYETPEITTDKDHYVLGEEIKFSVSNYDSIDLFEVSFDNIHSVKYADGKYTANRAGEFEATFTLKADGAYTTTVPLTIYATQVKLDLTSSTIAVGDKIGVWVYSFDNLFETSNDDFIFTVSDSKVAEIENRVLTAKAPGTVDIIATSKYNSRVTSKITVTVGTNEDLFMIKIPYEYGTLKVGDQFYVTLSQGHDISDFVWTTNNTEVIRVVNMDGQCQVTIVGKGIGALICYQEHGALGASYNVTINEIGDIDYIGRFLDLAYSQVGIKEVGENGQKYGEWYRNPNQPWCAQFVSWCWFHAGLSNELLVKYQSCYQGMKWCSEQGIMHYVQDYTFTSKEEMANGIHAYKKENYTPKPGDIVFFLSNGAGHTGIVGYCDGTYIYTIEGNRSNRVDVWRISLKNNTITGYASPNFPASSSVKDFSWLAAKQADGSYLWTNVAGGESTQ